MAENVLNKKLAEWAGFHISDRYPKKDYHYENGAKVADWVNPEGYVVVNTYRMGRLPNFTQSLDACFKWLWPRVVKYYEGLSTPGYYHSPYYFLANSWVDEWEEKKGSPSLALCLAIGKLIDSESK